MSDLVGFLRDRLDEDEAVARAAEGRVDELMGWVEVGIPEAERHLARHDPARVLAEVDAKRQVMDEHWEPTSPFGDWPTSPPGRRCPTCSDQDERLHQRFPCPTLQFLALPYADHPDYDPAWRP